jgi:hypothetical protein
LHSSGLESQVPGHGALTGRFVRVVPVVGPDGVSRRHSGFRCRGPRMAACVVNGLDLDRPHGLTHLQL